MSNLVAFQFESVSVRTITLDDQVWFVASDVAKALGYLEPHKAVSSHCKYAKSLKDMDGINYPAYINQGLSDQAKVIPESDIYRLTIKSKLESAERFQDWVCEEVLPSIRKTGSYNAKPDENVRKTCNLYPALAEAFKSVGITGNQLILAVDKSAKSLHGISLLSIGEVQLTSPIKELALNVTDIGVKMNGLKPTEVNLLLVEKGLQTSFRSKSGKLYYEPTEKGMEFAEYLDTNKKHSDGTPVKQLKWYTSVIDQLK